MSLPSRPPYLAGAFNLTQLTGGRKPPGAGTAGDQASLKLAAVTANGVTAVANSIYAGQACVGSPLVPPMVDMTQGTRKWKWKGRYLNECLPPVQSYPSIHMSMPPPSSP